MDGPAQEGAAAQPPAPGQQAAPAPEGATAPCAEAPPPRRPLPRDVPGSGAVRPRITDPTGPERAGSLDS